ncbi:hypothetical protein PC128_g6748 [Phytophthora cactorum]|nr:hypothetical protein PC128_g6748 [Phytophthora cactorum]
MARRLWCMLAHEQCPGQGRVYDESEDAISHNDSGWHEDRRSCKGHRRIEVDGRDVCHIVGCAVIPAVEGSLIPVSKLAEKDVVA